MPLYLQNSRLRNNDQAAAAASTQGVVEDVQRQYREATQPPQPSYALPDLSALGVSSAPTAPSPVMAAIGAIPQIGRRAQQVVQEQAPSWALPTLDSLGVTLQDGRQQPGPSMRPGETLGDVQITSGRRVGTPNGGVEQWSDLVDEASRAYGVPQSIIKGIMDIESGGRADAVSAAGALGLMQVMPFHYQQGEDGMDPRTSVLRGAKILADNYRRWGTWDQAAAAYFGAIDAQGNITGATDATGTDGTNYVRLFRDAANRYGGVPGAAPVMPRLSLNAAPADAPGRAAPPAPGGVSFTPPGAPPAPWEMAGAQDGGQALMKAENDWTGDDPNAEAFRRTNPIQYDEQGQEIHPRFTPGPPNQIRYDIFGNERPADVVPPEWPNWLPVPPNTGDPVISYRQPLGEQEAFLPGDGGYAPTPYEQPYDPDQGPREATPGSVGAQPLPQTDQNYPMTYGPIQQGDVQGPPAPAQTQMDRYVPTYQAQAAQVAPTMPSPAAGAVQAGIDAAVESYNDPFYQAGPQPPRWVKIVSDAMQAFGAESAKNVARSLGVTDEEWFNVFGYPISRVDVAGFAGGVLADPTNYVGMNMADPLVTVARGAVRDFAPEAVKNVGRAVGNAAREGAEALGRGLQGVGREVAGGLMDLQPGMAPRMAEGGPGIGRAMAEGAGEAPEAAAPRSRRFYHGTASEFGIPDPGKLDPDGLFGPGYYLTSDPRVAGSYAAQRGVASPGAAYEPIGEGVARSLTETFGNGFEPDMSVLQARDAVRDRLQRQGLSARQAQIRLDEILPVTQGQNVRAVDVPEGLRLLNLDGTLRENQALLDEVEQALPDPDAVKRFQNALRSRAARNTGPMTVEDIYGALEITFQSSLDALPRPKPSPSSAAGPFLTAKESANEILRRAGYDGIAHTGGKRVPLLDADGKPIEHDVTIIFPESLTKIRNAFSGEVGGGVVGPSPGPRGAGIGTQLATDAGNALAGSMVGAVAPADSNEERLRNTALGAAGFPIAGRLMRRAGGALGTPGIGPNGRPQQRTVEWLAEQIDYTKRVLADLDPATEGELIGQVQDRLARLQGEWVDAVNARRALEPRIRSEVGRRVNELPIDERTASDYAGIGRERVSPEAGIPRTVDDTPRSPGLNSAVPFDPTSAAMGGAAGAMSEGEDGEAGDPLRTAAGVFIAGLGNSRYGRRFIANAARNAKPGPPPNLWEIMQGFRFSWGMLGNLAQTGLVNAGGGPIELALGLPTEAARMSLLRGRPIGTAHYAIETLSGLKDGARGLLATALGEIPPSVRNAPDFRPPMSERLAGRMGQIGNVDTGAVVGEVIDLPGRLSSQAPDSLWRPLFLRAGAAQERNTIMAENGISKLDPAAQWRELQRLVNNPTPQEAQRIAEASRKYADEMGYKGDPGYLEEKLANLMRGGRIATSKDPLIAQIHEAGGSFVMPFLGAVYKLHKLAATRVPGLGFAANSKLPMDQKLARQAVGAATIYLLADYAAQGMVTGPGPSDPDEAAIVNKKMPPHSTYFPGVGWVPNDSLGSAGPYLNAIGGYYDARRYATEKDKATPGKGDESAVKYVLRGFERFPVVQAAQSVIAMAESPIKGVSDFAANAASSFAPALYRTYQGSQDQYARTVDREAGMDGGIVPALAEQTRQKIVSRVGYAPGLGAREDLQPALDRFGRPIENERQGVSAFLPRVSNPKDDALTDIFTRAGIEPGMPPAEVDKIPLTTEQKREWLRVRGESLAQKQDILSRAADYPEVRRKNVFEAQMSLASDRAAQAVRRMFTPEQRAAARKAG